jgi:hypothetical protein
MTTKQIKEVADMSASEINKRLDALDRKSSANSKKSIEAGRGLERAHETIAMVDAGDTDPLRVEKVAIWGAQDMLYREVNLRTGTNMSRLPRGFGPRKGGMGAIAARTASKGDDK